MDEACHNEQSSKRTIWPYLSPKVKNRKNNGASSSTYKVEEEIKTKESKVPLLFSFLALGLRYSHFVIL